MTQRLQASRHVLLRWTRFCLAGGAGMILQLAVLSLLLGRTPMSLPAATLLAVESAILINFAWHHRCTWADRPCRGLRDLLRRLLRYHAVSGLVSLGGASALTWIFSGLWGVHYLVANLAATGICSVLNFGLCDRVAFRSTADPAMVEAGRLVTMEAAGTP